MTFVVVVWSCIIAGSVLLCIAAASSVIALWVPLLGMLLIAVAVALMLFDVYRDTHHHR